MNKNIILMTDSYKCSHKDQYPPGTEYVNSYIESRGGDYDAAVLFGLQYFIKEYLSGPVITQQGIDDAERIVTEHGEPFHREDWLHILEEHGGRLPIVIEAVEEGTPVPIRNVLVQMRNTDPKCFWLVSYLETALLRAVWYGTTVASKSYWCKQTIKKYLEETSDESDHLLSFRLHDFGSRGVSSSESAAIGGSAHLLNFSGTDTVEALAFLRDYYSSEVVAGFSVPATEHSTMTTWGQEEDEEDCFKHMMDTFKEYPILSVVSDSFNYWNALEKWVDIWANDEIPEGMKLVIRPDSGDPVATVLSSLQYLWSNTDRVTNSKGYKVLPPNLGLLQGDGINPQQIKTILEEMKQQGFAASNIVFGMGGGLLQDCTRDTMKFAMKCSAVCVNGAWRDVWKKPVGDKSKASKRGILSLVNNPNGVGWFTSTRENPSPNKLKEVFKNGELLIDLTLEDVRRNTEL